MGKSDHIYLAQRAVEEMAAAERATSAEAAGVHRELSLRYSLRLILPEPASADDDARSIGEPKRPLATRPAAVPQPPASRRNRA